MKTSKTFISENQKFSDLNPGDIFVYKNYSYMKTLPNPFGNSDEFNAICLADGDLIEFSMDVEVIPKPNATLILDGIQ